MAMTLMASIAAAQDKPAPKPATNAAATATAATPNAPSTAPAPAVKDSDVVASAGPVSITKGEFEAVVKGLPEQYQQMAMGQGKRQFVDNLIRMKLLAVEAAKSGLENDPEVQRQLSLSRENILATAEFTRIDKATVVPDAEIQAEYDKDKSAYEQVHARHILIAFDGSQAMPEGKKRTEAEAKAKAEELYKKLTTGGAKFEDVAKAESDDSGSKENGGDLGQFNRGQMVKDFEEAAFATKPGEIAKPVKTEFGYHIIKVESHDFTPLAQVRAKIDKELHQKKVNDQLEAMNKTAGTKYNEAYFAMPAMATPPAPAAVEPKKN